MIKLKDITILEIDGMFGTGCVDRIVVALTGIHGVRTEAVTIGTATIDCDNKITFQAACAAVGKAGYKIRRATAPVRVPLVEGSTPPLPLPTPPAAAAAGPL
jgi:hypothetical protein